jgi:hypothetical protein
MKVVELRTAKKLENPGQMGASFAALTRAEFGAVSVVAENADGRGALHHACP